MDRSEIEEIWWDGLAYPRDQMPPYVFATMVARAAAREERAKNAALLTLLRNIRQGYATVLESDHYKRIDAALRRDPQ